MVKTVIAENAPYSSLNRENQALVYSRVNEYIQSGAKEIALSEGLEYVPESQVFVEQYVIEQLYTIYVDEYHRVNVEWVGRY